MYGDPMKCIVASKTVERVEDPLREVGAPAAEDVVIVVAVGVVAGRDQLGVEAIGAAREPLDDVVDLLAREQLVELQASGSSWLGSMPR